MADFSTFRQSIVARLILLVTVVAAPLIALQFYYVFQEAAVARQEALNRSYQSAQAIVGRIETLIRDIDSFLHTVAVTVPLQPEAIEQGNATLRKIKSGLPPYTNTISLTEPDGTNLYSGATSPPPRGSLNVADRRYFQDAIASNRLAVSEPIVARSTGKPVVVFARAIRDDASGQLRGVVSTSIQLARFQEAFVDKTLPHGSLITIFNREGVVVARSIEPDKWIGVNLSAMQAMQNALQGRKDPFELVTADGVKRLSTIAAVQDIPWFVLVGIPSETALAASRQHLQWAIILTLVVAGLAIAAAIRISQGIAIPLRRLARDAETLAASALGHRTNVNATGEVGELAASFNAMAQELDIQNRNLRASENKFAVAFRSSPDAILITVAADGRIVDMNDAGLRLMGFSREELIGRSTTELNMWADPNERGHYIGRLLEQGRMIDMQIEFRNKTGEVRIGMISGELIELDGRPHVLTVIRDITAQKQADEEILKLNTNLEQRVIERTAQLEAVNKELEAFSYSVSHDLKAPLRGIDGYSQLLEESCGEKLDDEARLFLRNIRQGTAQMHDLIEDLLAYSRMERRSLSDAALDLHQCVEEVAQGIAREVARNGAVLHTEVPTLIVHADREGLAIVLRNLLDNALKFSRDAQPPTITISARVDGDKVILWVRDNGIGFDMKFHERIFEIFTRLQRVEEYGGTGVGLALVRKAMLRMGGRVWAESAPGNGATFFLELRRGSS